MFSSFILKFCAALAIIFSFVILMGPKAYLIYSGATFDNDLNIVSKRRLSNNNNDQLLPNTPVKKRMISVIDSIEILKLNSIKNNIQLCKDQIDMAENRKNNIAKKHISEWKCVYQAVESNNLESVLDLTVVSYFKNYQLEIRAATLHGSS